MEIQQPVTLVQTKTQWRLEGRGIRRDATPARFLKWNDRHVALYAEDQTTKLQPYTVARNFLLDLFAGYPDTFGYTSTEDDCIYRAESKKCRGGARGLIEAGFNYRRCAAGIRIGKYRAETFHVPAPACTRSAVIDLDNHSPARRSTEIHLELVQRLQQRLPELARRIGLKSGFWQYRGIEPTGVQLWMVTTGERFLQHLHDQIRKFLLTLDQDNLDQRLRSCGLPGLADIEILPGEKLVSMPGCYGKVVFTDHELRVRDQRFDCEALYRHITGRKQAGEVYDRYRELVLVRDFQREAETPTPTVAAAQTVPETRLTPGAGYWSRLKFTCLHGVDRPDQLHGLFLKPIAEALLLREFHGCRDKQERTFQTLKRWVLKKHNGHVSRINDGKNKLVESQIRSTIRNIEKKPNQKIADFYADMRANDARFPQKRESLLPYMEAEDLHFFLKDCKGFISESGMTEDKPVEARREPVGLPEQVAERLRQYTKENMRRGRATERFLEFATRFVAEIGPEGDRQINERTLLGLAGRDAEDNPSTLKRWKRRLVAAGILCRGWEKNVVRGLRSSRYRLQAWVRQEMEGRSGQGSDSRRRTPENLSDPVADETLGNIAVSHFPMGEKAIGRYAAKQPLTTEAAK